MPDPDRKPPVLLVLAAEGVLPVLAGYAGVAAAGPVGGMAGVAVGHAVERAINLFGRGIVARWQAWFAEHPEEARAAVAALAAEPPAEARSAARSIFLELAPDAAPEDVDRAVEFLTAIPPAVDRAWSPTRPAPAPCRRRYCGTTHARCCNCSPKTCRRTRAETPPRHPVPAGELLGAGGFGAVYRADVADAAAPAAGDQVLPRPDALPALHREREQPRTADAGRRPRLGRASSGCTATTSTTHAVPRLRVRRPAAT